MNRENRKKSGREQRMKRKLKGKYRESRSRKEEVQKRKQGVNRKKKMKLEDRNGVNDRRLEGRGHQKEVKELEGKEIIQRKQKWSQERTRK